MSNEDALVGPIRSPWDPGCSVGHEVIDAQHRALLAQCDRLADACAGEADDPAFDALFAGLKALAREHFEAETAVLQACGFEALEDHRFECEEFEYLAEEIATTDHFDRVELQRFVALWFAGHIAGTAGRLREALAGGGGAG